MSSRTLLLGLCFAVVSSSPLVCAQSTQTTPELRRVDPPSPTATVHELEARGDSLRGSKFYADAVDYYMAAIGKHDSAVLRNKLGLANIDMMRFREAKRSFERAIKLDKKYAEAYNNLGAIYYIDDHNTRKAIRNYERAIKINDLQASFHSNLGTALFARKEYDHAAKEYQRAMEIDPTIFEHHSRNGISAQLTPQDRGQFSLTVAKLYLNSGDVQHCLLYLRKAQEEGIKVAEKLEKDPAFLNYKKDPRFIAVIQHQPLGDLPDRP